MGGVIHRSVEWFVAEIGHVLDGVEFDFLFQPFEGFRLDSVGALIQQVFDHVQHMNGRSGKFSLITGVLGRRSRAVGKVGGVEDFLESLHVESSDKSETASL
ncbi:MAG: hypothetical protein A2X84_01670 [Desulfuromonadaceae bacterium GWC2_58_13]|nr:MAG: hypothetical protein A2X84_01670 [Desulfuromonadaceae bacterium GWC2_58_13]